MTREDNVIEKLREINYRNRSTGMLIKHKYQTQILK